MIRKTQPAPMMREELNRNRQRPIGAPMATRCPMAAQPPAGIPMATYPRQDGEQRRVDQREQSAVGLITTTVTTLLQQALMDLQTVQQALLRLLEAHDRQLADHKERLDAQFTLIEQLRKRK